MAKGSVGDPDPDPQIRDPGSGSAYFYRDSYPQKIRNNFHADLIFADLKYTFKIWKSLAQCKKLD